MEKNIVCIHHKDCVDGTAAAAVVLKKYPHAHVFPIAHGYAPEEIDTIIDLVPNDAHVYIVDTTVGLAELLPRGYAITVIDHHVSERTRMEEVAHTHTNLTYIFDNKKSGASLAWSYLFPSDEVPMLIRHVEDNDLWKKALGEDTEHVVNYLSLWNNDPHTVAELLGEPIASITEKGRMITSYAHTQVGKLILLEPITLRIGSHDILAYNITDHQSACGNTLSKENDAAVALYTIVGAHVKISFRSHEHHEPSALTLAMTLGGGGHRNASGAKVPLKEFIAHIIHFSDKD